MAKLHGFARPIMEPITEFDAGDEDFVPKQKPKYARQLAMEGEERSDPPVENKSKEDWLDSHDSHGFHHVEIVRKVQVEQRTNSQIGGNVREIREDVVRFHG